MIRYEISAKELNQRVRDTAPEWLEDADTFTTELIQEGRYSDKALDWGDVKPVFMDLQANKCIFCEQQMEGERIHHDLEHFRPKSSIKKWPKKTEQHLFNFDMGDKEETGYHWLAYNLQNYAAACKFCNTSLKSNSFPIRLSRTLELLSVRDLNRLEKPFLCYPIGKIDTDPSRLIEFDVTVAKPVTKSGIGHDRARVIIEFFGLNRRDSLHYQRALFIQFLFQLLEASDKERTEFLLSSRAPHASCLRSFHRLWESDHDRAVDAYEKCKDTVLNAFTTNSPNLGV